MEIAILILIVAAPLAFVYPVGRWILGPIDREAEALQQPTRYRIVDFFCLVVEMQLVFALVAVFGTSPGTRIAFGVLLGLIVLAMWFKGVSTLSHAGIEDPWRRAAFNWYVLPMTYVGAVAYVPLIVALAAQLVDRGPKQVHWGLWISALACPLALLISKRAANWILFGAQQPAVVLEERTVRLDASEQLELP